MCDAKLVRALNNQDAAAGLRDAKALATALERKHPGAAASLRDGLTELFTVARLGITGNSRLCTRGRRIGRGRVPGRCGSRRMRRGFSRQDEVLRADHRQRTAAGVGHRLQPVVDPPGGGLRQQSQAQGRERAETDAGRAHDH